MKYLSSFLVFIFFLIGCNNEPGSSYETEKKDLEIIGSVNVERDYFPTKGWQTKTPSEVGLNEAVIEELIEEISQSDVNTMFIIKDGYLVEEYYKGSALKGKTTPINSVTKSIVSALIGIAIDKGYIESLEQKISDFLPELLEQDIDPDKLTWTIEHLLTMSVGLQWDEYGGEFGNLIGSNNWIDYTISQPLIDDPGETFNYNSGVSHLLSVIIERATGMSTKNFADEYLFSQIGIRTGVLDYYWLTDPDGYYTGTHGIDIEPIELTKLGYLFLNGGKWEGNQVISREWVETSTSFHIDTNYSEVVGLGDYGYLWWVDEFEWNGQIILYYYAVGYGGQYLYVIPTLDFILQFTGWLPSDANVAVYFDQLIQQYIVNLF